ncbi:MAG: class II aldolase/adducin family protein [Coriobacteriales bacterium]|nr:class II aldolase/adducin family protein [Coriobacteriales bacterium]
MDIAQIKQSVVDTGLKLVEEKLVARTWGNVSARIDETSFAISPSGLAYEKTTADDIAIYDFETEKATGPRKPSSEKGIHACAYKTFEDVNFVIHTHQDYATAIGLGSLANLVFEGNESEILGPIEIAEYGLPGTKTLKKNVASAFEKGAKVVLMKHHGAIILGKSAEDTLMKAKILEAVCKRSVLTKINEAFSISISKPSFETTLAKSDNLLIMVSNCLLDFASLGGFKTQLDDMAQMLGSSLNVVKNDNDKIAKALKNQDAVLVKGLGCVVHTEDEQDTDALAMLIQKAVISKQYTLACNVKADLSLLDCTLMRNIYKLKYSKKKAG